MKMLSETEKLIITEIVDLLSDEDLFSLSSTVTNRVIDVESRKEAEKAILAFTKSMDELLKRRKISKDILLKYMFNKGLQVSKDAEKDKLIADIIQMTISQPTSQSPNSNCISLPICQPSVPPYASFVSSPTNITINMNVNYYNSDAISYHSSEQGNAERFVTWFYDTLNRHNPILKNPLKEFGPLHFWENAQLFLVINSKSSKVEDVISGNQLVSDRLLKFPLEDMLLFLPNASSEGVKTKTDPHGLKLIIACGTLHLNSECVGIFQQSFGLIRDPVVPDVWKIKITCLKMDEHLGTHLPKLEDCTDIVAIEEHTVRALEQSIPNNG